MTRRELVARIAYQLMRTGYTPKRATDIAETIIGSAEAHKSWPPRWLDWD